ncbi:MAG: amidohydrolase family protein [Actinomycetota bacterium]
MKSPGLEPAALDPSLRDLPLRAYRPRASVRSATHDVPRGRFPVVDAHNHLGRWLTVDGGWAAADVGALLADMDSCNVEAVVNLDGQCGDELEANLDRYDRAYPGRFATFCHLDWSRLSEPGWPDRLVDRLRAAASAGARGVKVWKHLGLHLRDERGELLLPDDERLAPVWATAGELRLPVLIHVADPVAFFEPVDARNERLEELLVHPEWSFADPRFPRFDQLIDSLEAVIASHASTTFIGAHVGCFAEDLAWVARMLSTYANFHVDIAARIAELGRQPRAARRLFMEHADRVLFGLDLFPPDPAEYAIHFRFLETEDEVFDYSTEDVPPEGRWTISGLGLPDDVLRTVYGTNARRLIAGLAR